jgi:hypothetical protein
MKRYWPDIKIMEKSTMRRKNTDNRDVKHFPDLELGRLMATLPMFGQLSVYTKRDSKLGASVVCEEDGGKYGVTSNVLTRFSDVGVYDGWAYIDQRRGLVFKFIASDVSNRPHSLLAIETKTERLDVLSSYEDNLSLPHGTLVAFYAKFAGYKRQGQCRRQVTRIFAIDVGHPLLLAKLISGSRLAFPDHIEVLEMFFDALSCLSSGFAMQNRVQLDSALAKLSADSGVPEQFQQLARVERTKLASARTGQARTPSLQHQGTGTRTSTNERKNNDVKQVSTAEIPAKSDVIGDVVQIKLQLD